MKDDLMRFFYEEVASRMLGFGTWCESQTINNARRLIYVNLCEEVDLTEMIIVRLRVLGKEKALKISILKRLTSTAGQ